MKMSASTKLKTDLTELGDRKLTKRQINRMQEIKLKFVAGLFVLGNKN